MENSKLHVALLSSPGKGQVFPLLVLGNFLATHHHTKVTLLVQEMECQFVQSLSYSKYINVIGVPPVDLSCKLLPNSGIITRICTTVREMIPFVRSTLASMDHRPDVLIMDFFCSSVLPVAREFNMQSFLYMTTNAWASAFFMYSPVMDKEIDGEFIDQKEMLPVAGCKSVKPEDTPDPMMDRSRVEYYEYLQLAIEFQEADGILINTWEDLEPTSLEALRGNEKLRSVVKMPVYPIGPLIRPVEPATLSYEMFDWLDRQPTDSVLFISFGSGGVLSTQQTKELAFGLELSQQRFIWVVRPPYDSGLTSSDYPDAYLPEGFQDRTRDVGLVIPNWGQQVEILSHPAVGGFLSHCGWNSTLETIGAGVPMIAWPLYAEQRQNATMLTEDIGVAVRPEVAKVKKLVGREEIEKLVRKVIEDPEGQVMREKMKKLKFSADNTLRNGGSSFNSLSEALEKMRSHMPMSK